MVFEISTLNSTFYCTTTAVSPLRFSFGGRKGGHPGGDARGADERIDGLPRSRSGGGGRGATLRGGAKG